VGKRKNGELEAFPTWSGGEVPHMVISAGNKISSILQTTFIHHAEDDVIKFLSKNANDFHP
jgi:hypothetical protein